jgi:hypothetical protein
VFTGLSLNAAHHQNEVAAQAQYTDRYIKAVEQVGQQGPDKLQVRLGGIYAIERLTRDSPRDQPNPYGCAIVIRRRIYYSYIRDDYLAFQVDRRRTSAMHRSLMVAL